jgi:peptidoglycan hydrolase CwlO-like protein
MTVEPFFTNILNKIGDLDKKIISLDTKITKIEKDIIMLECKIDSKIIFPKREINKMEEVD